MILIKPQNPRLPHPKVIFPLYLSLACIIFRRNFGLRIDTIVDVSSDLCVMVLSWEKNGRTHSTN